MCNPEGGTDTDNQPARAKPQHGYEAAAELRTTQASSRQRLDICRLCACIFRSLKMWRRDLWAERRRAQPRRRPHWHG